VKHWELFFEYVNALECFPPESASFTFPVVLNCCYEFFKSLRTPVQFIVVDLPDPDSKLLSSMSPIWVQSSLSIDILCIDNRLYEGMLEFVNGINGSLTVYQIWQFDKLVFDIVQQFPFSRVFPEKFSSETLITPSFAVE
jgi:hypothetical protein